MLPVPRIILKLLLSRQLKWTEGRINLLNTSNFITPIEFFEYYTKFIKERGNKKDIDEYYLSSWVAGYIITKNLMQTYKLKTPQDRYTTAMNFLEVGGYGKYKTIEFRQGVRSHFLYLTNPLPLKFFPSKEPVCDFIRGISAGGGTWVHKKIVNNIELKCAAVNGKYCEFINFCFDDKKTIKGYNKLITNQFYKYRDILEFERNYIKKKKEKEILVS